MLRRSILFLGVLAVLAFAAGPALAVQYTITDLGVLPGGNASYAKGLNNSGQVTGYGYTSDGTRAFLWDGGVMTNLGTVGTATSIRGSGINDDGTIVGQASGQAMIYDGTNGMQYLFGGTSNSAVANGIYGDFVVGQEDGHAYLYDMSSSTPVYTNLQSLMSGSFMDSTAIGVNGDGDVVGYFTPLGIPTTKPFLYHGGSVTDLSTVITNASTTAAINDNGWIVGGKSGGGAYLWDGTTTVDMGMMPDGQSNSVTDINNSGLAVGSCNIKLGPGTFDPTVNKAYIYDGALTELYTLLDAAGQAAWSNLDSATAINDVGQIVGYGTIGNQFHAFLMTPVPEPSTIALTALGLVGLLCYAWRKRK